MLFDCRPVSDTFLHDRAQFGAPRCRRSYACGTCLANTGLDVTDTWGAYVYTSARDSASSILVITPFSQRRTTKLLRLCPLHSPLVTHVGHLSACIHRLRLLPSTPVRYCRRRS